MQKMIMQSYLLLSLGLLATTVAQAGWDPEPPTPDKWDWIQLTSGEWLKGKIISMYEDEVEFDSDELDTLFFDIDDIKRVRSGQVMQLLLQGGVVRKGQLIVDGDRIGFKGQEETFSTHQVITVTSASHKESDLWSIKYSLGANIRSGNTNQIDLNSNLKLQRRSTSNRFVFDHSANFSETNDEETANNQRASASWDFFITDALFWRAVFGEYSSDSFQNISHKYTIGTGIGYQIIDNKRVEWGIVSGPAYQETLYDSVDLTTDPDADDKESSAALFMATNMDIEVTADIDFYYDYSFTVVSEDAGRYTHHMVTGLDIDLGNFFELNVSVVWDRTQNPRPDADMITPEKDDYRMIVGIGFDY